MKEYLFYVTKYNIFVNDYALFVYKCKTNDPFHTIGEIFYRTFEHIKRIDFVEYSIAHEKFWEKHKTTIIDWYNKY